MIRMLSPRLPLAIWATLLVACSSQSGAPPPAADAGPEDDASTQLPEGEPAIVEDLQGREYDVIVPSSYDGATPVPLAVMIHQLWPTPDAPYAMDEYLHISPEAEARGVILAIPFGNFFPGIDQYGWNATDSCCDYSTPGANDVGYIMAMVNRIRTDYRIDDTRIFMIGQSNGSFMAHRLACDRASVFAGIVTLTGATYKDPDKCFASEPVAVMHYHGDQDQYVPFEGGSPFGVSAIPPAPSAEETARIWAEKNDCEPEPDRSQPPMDMVPELPGAETERVIYGGCAPNGAAELRIVRGGEHTPLFDGALWATEAFSFLLAHPKP